MKEIIKGLPEYDYIYLGDTARTPYGARSQEVIRNFTEEAVGFLFKRNCQLIILACNTASSEALRKIQREYLPKNYPNRRVLGVIVPAAESAVVRTNNNCIGVIATESTVRSKAFEKEVKKLNPQIEVFQEACPLLAPLVENGEENSGVTELAIRNYLSPLLRKNIDTLILGCTHYGILEDKIRKIVGPGINLVSEGAVVADKLKDYLQRHKELDDEISRNAGAEFFTTDLTDKFQILGSKFFGKRILPKRAKLG